MGWEEPFVYMKNWKARVQEHDVNSYHWEVLGQILPDRDGVLFDTYNSDHCLTFDEEKRIISLAVVAPAMLATCKAAADKLAEVREWDDIPETTMAGINGVIDALNAQIAEAEQGISARPITRTT